MGAEFDQALEQDREKLQAERDRFNQAIQELANLLEARRQEVDGSKIDTGKLAVLNAQVEFFIAQLKGGEEAAAQTSVQKEVSPSPPEFSNSSPFA